MQSMDAKLAFTSFRLYVADMLATAAATIQRRESPRWLTEQHDVAVRLPGTQQAHVVSRNAKIRLAQGLHVPLAGRVREHITTVRAVQQATCYCYWGCSIITRPWSPGRFHASYIPVHLNRSNHRSESSRLPERRSSTLLVKMAKLVNMRGLQVTARLILRWSNYALDGCTSLQSLCRCSYRTSAIARIRNRSSSG